IGASIEREREVFGRLKLEALEGWLALADERLPRRRTRGVLIARNHDPPAIDALLASSHSLVDVQGATTELAPGVWMASRGESTPTPRHNTRETPDATLGDLVEPAVRGLPPSGTTIWNLHMPPFD